VDNPWANESVLKQLFNHRFDNPVIKAVFDGRGGHPILINSLVMNYIKSYEDDSITLKKLLNQFSCTSVMVDDPNILININCPEDYNRYFPDMPFPLDI
jgi:CTP:molybdopterin cytidylyltransferase MocA